MNDAAETTMPSTRNPVQYSSEHSVAPFGAVVSGSVRWEGRPSRFFAGQFVARV